MIVDPGVGHRHVPFHNSLKKKVFFSVTVEKALLSRLRCEAIRGNTPLVRHVPFG